MAILREEQDDAAVLIEALADVGGLTGPLSQRVYKALKDAILEMRLPPGAVLRKNVICERLNVSRSPVSEAITLLSTEGLVDVVPQSATRVSKFSVDEIREESFLRDAIEVAAVSKVAVERTADQLAQLTRNVRLQQLLAEDADFRGFFASDEEFHALILAFTGFNRVAEVSGQLSLQVRRARMLLLPERDRMAETVAEHAAILDAIRAQDPEAAAQAMRRHLGQLISRIEPLEQRHPEFFRQRRH